MGRVVAVVVMVGVRPYALVGVVRVVIMVGMIGVVRMVGELMHFIEVINWT